MRVILSCGGTGGHIYPAIAIADKIRERYADAQILFIGTKKGMENNLVPAAGYEIKGIDARGCKAAELQRVVSGVEFRHYLTEQQQDEREQHGDAQEFQPRSGKMEHAQQRIVAEQDDGDVDKIVRDEDGGKQLFRALKQSTDSLVAQAVTIIQTSTIGGRQREERYLGC